MLIQELLKLREAKLGVDLEAMCATLKKHRMVDSADVYASDDAIDVTTKKGDVVRFTLNKTKGQFYASVQGQKHDIDIGDIGETTTDMLEFMAGLNKNWYREYDDDFDD
jgi:hypothetical protein